MESQLQRGFGGRRGLPLVEGWPHKASEGNGIGLLLPLHGFQQPKTSANLFLPAPVSPLKVENWVWCHNGFETVPFGWDDRRTERDEMVPSGNGTWPRRLVQWCLCSFLGNDLQ